MNLEKLTKKSMEAIREAQECAIRNQNMQIDQQHLLYALLNQADGAVGQIMKKAKLDARRMAASCDREIQRIPKVSGPGREPDKVYISQSVDAALTEAEQQAEYMKDEFVSVEHIMLGLIEKPNGAVKAIFGEFGLTKEIFLEAMQKVRGNARVTSENPEDTYDALMKYGVDLTEKARADERDKKLDPVIGRDEEIRNVVRILSRKTKNNPVLI
ncbi:MAG: type VI secretion system ATPase TssH, partial [Clostridia bacterium]|nr:type VI secretion system ATPase TssH [Clostridia bacterium]